MKSQVHSREKCAGQTCAVHNPSHHMGDWPWRVRWDRDGMIERDCAHGVGHPDPDSVRWIAESGGDCGGLVHGCCAEQCCTAPQRVDPEPLFSVQVGQIWADNDYRKSGRTLKITALEGNDAICQVLTNYDHVQEELDKGYWSYQDMRGTQTTIKVRRLYPNARGYRLIEDQAA